MDKINEISSDDDLINPDEIQFYFDELKNTRVTEELIEELIVDLFSKYDFSKFDKKDQEYIINGYSELLKMMNEFYSNNFSSIPSYGKFFMHFVRIAKYLETNGRTREIAFLKNDLNETCSIINKFCEYNGDYSDITGLEKNIKHPEQLVVAKIINNSILNKISNNNIYLDKIA